MPILIWTLQLPWATLAAAVLQATVISSINQSRIGAFGVGSRGLSGIIVPRSSTDYSYTSSSREVSSNIFYDRSDIRSLPGANQALLRASEERIKAQLRRLSDVENAAAQRGMCSQLQTNASGQVRPELGNSALAQVGRTQVLPPRVPVSNGPLASALQSTATAAIVVGDDAVVAGARSLHQHEAWATTPRRANATATDADSAGSSRRSSNVGNLQASASIQRKSRIDVSNADLKAAARSARLASKTAAARRKAALANAYLASPQQQQSKAVAGTPQPTSGNLNAM